MSRGHENERVVIRAPGQQDLGALHSLILAHARFERSEATVSGDNLRDILAMERPPTRFLLAEAGRLVGYSAMTVDFSTWSGKHYGHMDCLFVAEEMRGLGIGRSLFDATLKAAQRMGLEHLEWQTPAWNSRASDFYTRQGAMFSEKLRFRIGL